MTDSKGPEFSTESDCGPAYIPLQRKTIRVGSSRWLGPPTPQFCFTYINMLVSKYAKICVTPNANAKICVTPNANPTTQVSEI